MQKSDIRRICRLKYDDYRDQVITKVKGLPPQCRQSGDDSVLEDVWEEYKYQVQREESAVFYAYEETIEAICHDIVKSLPQHELELLWLDSDAYFDHDDEDGPPDREELVEGVERELYQKVSGRAADEDLKVDPDEANEIE